MNVRVEDPGEEEIFGLCGSWEFQKIRKRQRPNLTKLNAKRNEEGRKEGEFGHGGCGIYTHF
ncbi:unnamed protein product [Coffea canephora]|uniref:Uncharacterized protein n=1 Tax=Coffea canephora TaxID=49390 RepID=A0A068U2Y4_COFCA|nr:unnamed protein product [Coffea canephora]